MSTKNTQDSAEISDSRFMKVVDYFLKTPKSQADQADNESDASGQPVEKIRPKTKKPTRKRQSKLDRRTTK